MWSLLKNMRSYIYYHNMLNVVSDYLVYKEDFLPNFLDIKRAKPQFQLIFLRNIMIVIHHY